MELTKHAEVIDRKSLIVAVNKQLHIFCAAKTQQAKTYDSSYRDMWQIIDTYLMAGGKRIRPYLTLLSYSAYGGSEISKVLPAACAWELLHAGLLIHDDIIDRDTIRHGVPNITGEYLKKYSGAPRDSQHLASSSALLAGDLLLSGAQEIVLGSDLNDSEKITVCTYLTDAIFCVGGGELLDVESVLGPIAHSSPEKIAAFKTAGYSFEYPLMCGAFLAGASSAELDLLQEFGKNVGITFQLIDDILGVFGDTAKTGKPNDSDIREKKRTALIKAALENLSNADRQRLEELFVYAHELIPADIKQVHAFIEKAGAREIIQTQALEYAEAAKRIIVKLNVSDAYKKELEALVAKLLVRLG